MFTNFAHSGVEHASSTETAGHLAPQLIGLCLITMLLLYAAARQLSNANDKQSEDEE